MRPEKSDALLDQYFFLLQKYHDKGEIHSFPMVYNTMGSRVATFDPIVLYNIHRWKTVNITFFIATQQTMLFTPDPGGPAV